jgi:dynein heavy chain
MVASVRHVFAEGLNDYAVQPRNDWVISHPG